MADLKSQKVSSADTGSFTETTEFKVLHCGNIEGNNNKFYCLEKQKDPKTGEFRLFTHYGRLGKTNTYEVRGPADESIIDKEFAKILKSKTKVRKDSETKLEYKYEEVDTFSPTVGSVNIRSKTAAVVSKAFIPDFSLLKMDDKSKKIVRQAYEENIHNITSKTDIRMTSSGLETPLGPVTKDHILSARNVLDGIKDTYDKKNKKDEFKGLNSQYFSKIPHPFGMKIPEDSWLDDETKLLDEYDLLEQLEAAVQIKTTNDDDKKKEKKFDLGFDICHIEDSKKFKSFHEMVESSRASNHGNLRRWKVKNAYEVNVKSMSKKFSSSGKKLKPIKTLFHGSRNCNILSILMNGLVIPPVSASNVTGRMFGNGVYGASSSTKSLNYSVGYWGGIRNKYPNTFLFIVDFGMGKIKETDCKITGPIAGYDSVWAKAGSSLYNDEFIVYNLGQVNITHLLELEEK